MVVSRSAYYDWLANQENIEQEEYALDTALKELFKASKNTYGSRRLAKELSKSIGPIGRYKISRLMKELGLQARYPKRFRTTTDSNHHLQVAPNILDRNFNVEAPNKVWTTDITYVWTLQGWIYVAVVMDLYSRQIVGWSIDDHMQASLCVRALQMAYWRKKPPPGLLHHSDRGVQYASYEYRDQLKKMNMEQSMSRKGNCWDNAPTERFFRSMKYESLNYERFATKAMAKSSILDYFAFYNGRRINSVLDYSTPLAFEQNFYTKLI
jgi:transposase InsO family protein